MKPETYPKYVADLVDRRPRKFCFSNRLIPTTREFMPRSFFYEPIRSWFPVVELSDELRGAIKTDSVGMFAIHAELSQNCPKLDASGIPLV